MCDVFGVALACAADGAYHGHGGVAVSHRHHHLRLVLLLFFNQVRVVDQLVELVARMLNHVVLHNESRLLEVRLHIFHLNVSMKSYWRTHNPGLSFPTFYGISQGNN